MFSPVLASTSTSHSLESSLQLILSVCQLSPACFTKTSTACIPLETVSLQVYFAQSQMFSPFLSFRQRVKHFVHGHIVVADSASSLHLISYICIHDAACNTLKRHERF